MHISHKYISYIIFSFLCWQFHGAINYESNIIPKYGQPLLNVSKTSKLAKMLASEKRVRLKIDSSDNTYDPSSDNSVSTASHHYSRVHFACDGRSNGDRDTVKQCKLPACKCQDAKIPNNLPVARIPQFVMLTFDDAINSENFDLYLNLSRARINPNACPAQFTFFVSHEWTNYQMVAYLYDMGHEIASHSITHRTPQTWWKDASAADWKDEIAGQRKIISELANIPLQDIKGMRAPFLQIGGNRQFSTLQNEGFEWDSSLPTRKNEPPLWPFTLHEPPYDCQIPPCPTMPFDIWEVPMVDYLDSYESLCAMVDQCSLTSDNAEVIFEFMGENFLRHYASNKAPFPIFMHSAWLTNNEERKRGFFKFLDTIAKLEDVYLVSISQVLSWIKNPKTIDEMKAVGESPLHDNLETKVRDYSSDARVHQNRKASVKSVVYPLPYNDIQTFPHNKLNSHHTDLGAHKSTTNYNDKMDNTTIFILPKTNKKINRSKRGTEMIPAADDYDIGNIDDRDFITLYPYCGIGVRKPLSVTQCKVKKYTECFYQGKSLSVSGTNNNANDSDLLTGSQSTSHYLQSCAKECPLIYPWLSQQPNENNVVDADGETNKDNPEDNDYLDYRKRKYFEGKKQSTYDLLSKIFKTRNSIKQKEQPIEQPYHKKRGAEKATYLLPERLQKKYVSRDAYEYPHEEHDEILPKPRKNLEPSRYQSRLIPDKKEENGDYPETKIAKNRFLKHSKPSFFSNPIGNKREENYDKHVDREKKQSRYEDDDLYNDKTNNNDNDDSYLYEQNRRRMSCKTSNCYLPYCNCVSAKIPFKMRKKDIPQLILLSFAGAINELNYPTYLKILGNISNSKSHTNRKKRSKNEGSRLRLNPNGCPIAATFFVSHEWTNYQMVHDLFNRGHEIALNSISYPEPKWWETASYDDWAQEIGDQKKLVANFANITEDEIVGLRVPYLMTGGDKQFRMLKDYGFEYDATIATESINPPIWPYTLDYPSSLEECSAIDCPTDGYPGIWEIPIIKYVDGLGKLCTTLPNCQIEQDEPSNDKDDRYMSYGSRGDVVKEKRDRKNIKRVFDLLSSNFQAHYETNKAPFHLAIYWEWLMPHNDGHAPEEDTDESSKNVEEKKRKKRDNGKYGDDAPKYYDAVEANNNADDGYGQDGSSKKSTLHNRHHSDKDTPESDYSDHGSSHSKNVNLEALLQFLDLISTMDDVYIVTHKDAITWMKNPLDIENLANPTSFLRKQQGLRKQYNGFHHQNKKLLDDAIENSGPWMCKRALNYGRNDFYDNNVHCTVKEFTNCAYDTERGLKYFFPCGECPANYPWTKNPLGL